MVFAMMLQAWSICNATLRVAYPMMHHLTNSVLAIALWERARAYTAAIQAVIQGTCDCEFVPWTLASTNVGPDEHVDLSLLYASIGIKQGHRGVRELVMGIDALRRLDPPSAGDCAAMQEACGRHATFAAASIALMLLFACIWWRHAWFAGWTIVFVIKVAAFTLAVHHITIVARVAIPSWYFHSLAPLVALSFLAAMWALPHAPTPVVFHRTRAVVHLIEPAAAAPPRIEG